MWIILITVLLVKNCMLKRHEPTLEDSGWIRGNRAYSHDITATILVFQNNDMAAILVLQTNPLGVGLFLSKKISFVPINLHRRWPREWTRSITLLIKKHEFWYWNLSKQSTLWPAQIAIIQLTIFNIINLFN